MVFDTLYLKWKAIKMIQSVKYFQYFFRKNLFPVLGSLVVLTEN